MRAVARSIQEAEMENEEDDEDESREVGAFPYIYQVSELSCRLLAYIIVYAAMQV